MTTAATYTNRGRIEADQLTRALIDLAARGIRPRCGDYETSHLWLSEDEHERAEASKLCQGCDVLTECGEVGKYQSFGVFGGVDRSVRPGGKKVATNAQT
jgi:hypothetical protein